MEENALTRKKKVEIEINCLEASTIAMAIEIYIGSVSRFMPSAREKRYKSIIQEFRKIGEQY